MTTARDEGPNGRESEAAVHLAEAMRQKSAVQTELVAEGTGREARSVRGSGEAEGAMDGDERSGTGRLMEEVVERGNLLAALHRVQANKGSPGIDRMTVDALVAHLVGNWPEIKARLLDGSYEPQPVRKVEIPKAGGGTRTLGIPTVVDRLVQQAILQVLQPRLDPTFSPHSYGFRPGRRAHDAVCAAQRYIQQGLRWVVDVDLEKFFDRVSHDVLMGRLERRIGDRRLLGVIRRFLRAGMMADGVVQERHEGTPQGGPLSPLLANVLLDEVDKELERRGLRFARYADDCNVYVGSRRAGEDVMALLRGLYEGLHLRVNEAKSAVARPWERKFLGFSFWDAPGREVRRKVAPKAIERFKEKVRELTARNGGRSLGRVVEELAAYLRGWKGYFGLAQTPGILRELDEWIRHRLRAIQLKQWKRGRTAYRRLRRLGASERTAAAVAAHTRRWWHNSGQLLHTVLTVAFFDRLGLPKLA
jgi:group II intron reverse transcriptase/maturase